MSFNRSRRSFIKVAVLAPLAYAFGVSRKVFAAKKTVVATADQAKAGLVDVKKAGTPGGKTADTMAKALKYVHKTEKKDQKCENCMQYSQAVDAGGKDVSIAVPGAGNQKVGACALFDAGKGYVCSGGYCMSWFKAPA